MGFKICGFRLCSISTKATYKSAGNTGRLQECNHRRRANKKLVDSAAPYNIGIATGTASGSLLVIDLDVDKDKGKDGKRAATQWLKEYGRDFPKTAIARTGRGGLHMIFYGNGRNKTNLLPGVDVRGEGGYIVAPPSIHPNGNSYQWLTALQIAAADETVYDFINQSESKARNTAPKGDTIPEGQRTNALIRLIGSLKG